MYDLSWNQPERLVVNIHAAPRKSLANYFLFCFCAPSSFLTLADYFHTTKKFVSGLLLTACKMVN